MSHVESKSVSSRSSEEGWDRRCGRRCGGDPPNERVSQLVAAAHRALLRGAAVHERVEVVVNVVDAKLSGVAADPLVKATHQRLVALLHADVAGRLEVVQAGVVDDHAAEMQALLVSHKVEDDDDGALPGARALEPSPVLNVSLADVGDDVLHLGRSCGSIDVLDAVVSSVAESQRDVLKREGPLLPRRLRRLRRCPQHTISRGPGRVNGTEAGLGIRSSVRAAGSAARAADCGGGCRGGRRADRS